MTSFNRRPERLFKAKRRKRTSRKCYWCHTVMDGVTSTSWLAATRDHVVPSSKGGRTRVWCCRACNNVKGDMMPDQWREARRIMWQNGLTSQKIAKTKSPRGVRLYFMLKKGSA